MISFSLFLCLLLFVCPLSSFADDNGLIQIADRSDMTLLAAYPDAAFELTADIDMGDEDWLPIPFSGKLYGNGHTIYNLSVQDVGTDKLTTYDGNRIEYETVFAGLFSIVTNAEITDLHLINAKISIETDQHCFTGALAGYASSSVFSDCSAAVRSHLAITSVNAGVGGLIGFSLINEFRNCNVDAELVFTDQNPDVLCEEFMGGMFASGCGNVRNGNIRVRAFTEIYGYAHNGGVIGMVKLPRKYPKLFVVANTSVDAEISFFEITPSRRAYCDPLMGENLAGDCRNVKNTVLHFESFESPEPVRLSPERCDNPHYSVIVTPQTHESWGYTTFTCDGCGYSYRDAYTSPGHCFSEIRKEPTCSEDGSVTITCIECGESHTDVLPATGHVPGEFAVVKEATVQEEGLMQRLCTVCGTVLEARIIPVLPDTNVYASCVTLSMQTLSLHCGEKALLSASVIPEHVTDPSIIFESSDPSVARVLPDGTVLAGNRGTAVITAISGDGLAFDTCTVAVSFSFAQWFRYYILFGWTKDS